mgnify:CR=1 FL=1
MTLLKEIVKFKEKNPTSETLLVYMREVLKKNPSLLKYEKGKPYIYFEYSIESDPQDEIEDEAKELYYAVRNAEMIECDIDNLGGLVATVKMFHMVEERGLKVSHIMCGNLDKVLKWIGQFATTNHIKPTDGPVFLGVKLYQFNEIPEDVIIFCGAHSRTVQPNEVVFALKGTM